MGWRRTLSGLVFILTLFISAFLGTVFILVPLLPLAWLRPAAWRRAADRLIGFWTSLPVVLLPALLGVNVEVSGDAIASDAPAVVVMNHRTRLDWLYFFSALYHLDPLLLTSEKITLKNVLRKVPGGGWAMGCNSYIFLDRQWELDRHTIDTSIEYYVDVGSKYQMLFFPEGTDMCVNAIGRSNKHADEKGLPRYEHVLYPRTTGFVHLVRKMRAHKYLGYVYDVTVGYPDARPQSEAELVFGTAPKRVCFDVRRYPAGALPEDDAELGDWLKQRWHDKERQLDDFYGEERQGERSFGRGDGGKTESGAAPRRLDWSQRLGLGLSLSFWSLTTLLWTYFVICVPLIRLYALVTTIGLYCATWRCGGLERLVIDTWLRSRVPTSPPANTRGS